MRPSKRTSKKQAATPLDAKQQALAEQQQKLIEQMERLERIIQQAPLVAEETEKRRREELLVRAAQSERRRHAAPAALLDKRYNVQAPAGRRKSLKAEKAEARLKFFVFCLILLGLLAFLYTKIL